MSTANTMNLKEAFRYQNFLNSLLSQAVDFLSIEKNVVTIKEKHLRSKANSNAEDMEKDLTTERRQNATANDAIEIINAIADEKEKLCYAIAKAKKGSEFDIDVEVQMNQTRQMIARNLSFLLLTKNKTEIKRGAGRDYAFNNEGNQNPYVYDIEVTSTIDFDPKEIKVWIKKYSKQADEVSSKIDSAMINTVVLHTPAFDVNDSFTDIIEAVHKKNDPQVLPTE